MTRIDHNFAFVALAFVAAQLTGFPTTAYAETVFAANYDVRMTAGEADYQVTSRARVRSGSAIPVEFQSHRLELHLLEAENDSVVVEIVVYEKSDGRWYQTSVNELQFEAKLGSPVEYQWGADDLKFDLAMIIGRDLRGTGP